MSIRIVCPSCSKVYNLDETMKGKTVRCRACQSSIAIPALAAKGGRPPDERIASSSRPASASGRARRDEDDDEPRGRPAERRPARKGKDSRGSKNVGLILLGVGAAALVLIGVVVGGVILIVFSMREKSDKVTASSAPPPVAAQSKIDKPPAQPMPVAAPVNAPPVGNAPPAGNVPARPAPVNAPPAANAPPPPDFVPVDAPPADNEPPLDPGQVGDLALLKGTWQSGPVGADGGGAAGIIKFNISPQAGGRGGRIQLVIATKQGGRTTSAKMNYAFTLEQKGGERFLVTHISQKGRGMVFLYRFEGGQLFLSGLIASARIRYRLQNIPLRRTSAEPQMPSGGNPANPAPAPGG